MLGEVSCVVMAQSVPEPLARTVCDVPSRRVQRPDPPPLETDDVTVVAIGTALWAGGLLVLLVLKATGAEVRDWWLVMCGYGLALGIYGVHYCRRRHAALERDRARGIPHRS